MKIFKINIAKVNILHNVALTTAYAAVKSVASREAFDKMATIDEDMEILNGFFSEVCSEIADNLKEFISAVAISGDKFELSLEVSGAFDESLIPSIESDAYAAVVAGITARWFRYSYPERAAEWDVENKQLLRRLLSKLCHRRKPVRQPSPLV